MIAGIDPGTTVGWAVINFSGELIAIGSQKEFNKDALVAELVKTGRVLVIGSDKAKIPSFVQETASKLGARVFFPNQDLRVEEKREMTREYSFGSAHQMDALAGALVAYRKLLPLLTKMRSFLQREQKIHLFTPVAELVIKERIGIRAALAILEPVPVKEETASEEEKRDEDIVQLYSSLVRLRKDNAILWQKNRLLEKRVQEIQTALDGLRRKTSTLVKPKIISEETRLKHKQVLVFSQRLEEAKKREQELAKVASALERHLLALDTIAIPRIRSLSWEQVNSAKEFLIDDAIFFVDDIHAMSTQAIQWLKTRNVAFAVTGKPVGENARHALPFPCVTTKEYELFSHIAIIKRALIEKFKSEKGVLSKVLDEYKKHRIN